VATPMNIETQQGRPASTKTQLTTRAQQPSTKH